MTQPVTIHGTPLCCLQTGYHILGCERRTVGKGGCNQAEAIGLQVGGAAVALAQNRLRPILGGYGKQALVHQGKQRPVRQPGAGVRIAASLWLVGQAKAPDPLLPAGFHRWPHLFGGRCRLPGLRGLCTPCQKTQAQCKRCKWNEPWHHNPSCGSWMKLAMEPRSPRVTR